MARKVGDRNRDFEAKRARLVDALDLRLRAPDAARVTVHEMAAAAGVSPASLRHHLGDREQIVAAVLERQRSHGTPHLIRLAQAPPLPLGDSVREALHQIRLGLVHGVGDLLANGLALSLRNETTGPAFVSSLLEPILQALEARLAEHQRRGELRADADLRLVALGVLSPLILAALHQHGLCGDRVRPLDLDEVIDAQVTVLERTWGAPSADDRVASSTARRPRGRQRVDDSG